RPQLAVAGNTTTYYKGGKAFFRVSHGWPLDSGAWDRLMLFLRAERFPCRLTTRVRSRCFPRSAWDYDRRCDEHVQETGDDALNRSGRPGIARELQRLSPSLPRST